MRSNILKTTDVYSDKTCEDFQAYGYNTEFAHAAGIVCFAVLSMIVTGSVALMMSNNKQLMSHPNKLIFYMCICEGIVAWQAAITHLGPQMIICYFQLDDIWKKTLFWHEPQ